MLLICYILSFLLNFSGSLSNDEIRVYLKDNLKGYEKFEFETVSCPRIKFKENIKIDKNKEFKLTGNTAYIPVSISENNSKLTTASFITVRVKLYRKVYIAKSSIRRGQELKINDFQTIIADVANIRGKIIDENFLLSSYKSKFNIDEREILTEELIEPIPVIKRGNKVFAYSITGNVVISMEAAARQDGSIGEVIRIVTPDKKVFKAKVLDSLNVNIIQ